jgi:hypothetical protein
MRFKREHTLNGVRHPAGAAFCGDPNTATVLYRKGILEPDGGPLDDLVTAASARQEWDAEPGEPPKEQ